METIGAPFLWLVFAGVVVVALLADLVLMRHGGPHKVTFKEAAWWSIGWVALALAFNAWLWWHAGERFGAEEGGRIGRSSSPATWSRRRWRSTTSSCS